MLKYVGYLIRDVNDTAVAGVIRYQGETAAEADTEKASLLLSWPRACKRSASSEEMRMRSVTCVGIFEIFTSVWYSSNVGVKKFNLTSDEGLTARL